MRKRVLLLACALGTAGVVGLSPQAHAGCTKFEIGDRETRCLEDIVCGVASDVPGLCPLT